MSAIQEYKALDYPQKKQYLSQLLAIFADYSLVAKDMLARLADPALEIPVADMEQVYGLFVDAIAHSSKEKLEHAVARLATLQAKMQALHDQEQADRAQEDPDAILDTI